MSARRFGLPGRGKATKVVVWLLIACMIGLFSTTYLLGAGLPVWVVILLVLVVLAVPVSLAALTDDRPQPDRE